MDMSQQETKALLLERAGMVEEALSQLCTDTRAPQRLRDAMRYSLLAGGKRLRPVLCLTAARLCGTEPAAVLPFACGLEMVHTYSLIHDDLPAMDNDDLRRGRPSSHKAFDEATAILAGDALQAEAFRIMTTCELPAGNVLQAVQCFADAAGACGMCGGQELDMQYTGKRIAIEELEHLHALKTGAILRASVVCGGLLAGADEKCLAALSAYGTSLGVAFQIADDILDVVSDTETLGKPAGSDQEQNKNTYPALLGLERSRELADMHAEAARRALDGLEGRDADFLRGLAQYTVRRVK